MNTPSSKNTKPIHPPFSSSVLKELKQLHFQTKMLIDTGISGQYRSAFKGRGIEFDEVREYTVGDDIRSIDWKVTARHQKPFMKSYREERDLTVFVAVDISSSLATGTKAKIRSNVLAQAGAMLSLIALNNNDNVGLVTYSDRLETYHPARKARSSVWRILHEVLHPTATHPGTDLKSFFALLNKVIKRRSIVFILSDFLDSNYERELNLLASRHDVTAVCAEDPSEKILPHSGLVTLEDPETSEQLILDTNNELVMREYERLTKEKEEQKLSIFRKANVGLIRLSTDKEIVPEFKRFLRSKHKRHAA